MIYDVIYCIIFYRQTLQESYNDLQIIIQHHLTQNSEVIASLTATVNESKTQRNEMADKVIYLSVCLSICIKYISISEC